MMQYFPLSTEQLQRQAPSIFAQHAWEGVSSKYAFLSTQSVIEALAKENILPYRVNQSSTRIEGKGAYTKHMLRFRPQGWLQTVNNQPVQRRLGQVTPEILVINSHDRASSFQIELGLMRLVCHNGMVVSAGNLESFRVRHVGSTVHEVIEATYRIIQHFPKALESVKRFSTIQLTEEQRQNFAAMALGLRWEADKVPFAPARLLSTRRVEDTGTDLWSTLNVIQENLIKGQHRQSWTHSRASRAVHSIDVDMKINKGLWTLAEKYATA